jgi:cytochrome c553
MDARRRKRAAPFGSRFCAAPGFGLLVTMVAAGWLVAADAPQRAPDWAYGYLKPLGPSDPVAPACSAEAKAFPDCAYPAGTPPEDGMKRELPGAAAKFTRNEAYFDYGPADWYPNDHPAMPDIVAHGKQAVGARACALCHFPNGQGKMENGGVAGLSAGYILQQLKAFKNGDRRSADPRKANTNEMAQIARSLTDEEANAAANYFASMKWRPWVKVVEAEQAPAVRSTTNGLFLPIPKTAPVALGDRIIEVPENPERTDIMRDPHSGFVAYVPVGSIAKGESLASTGGGKTTACAGCHGTDLKGKGDIPGIAGRCASYLMRQLWDFKQGARKSRTMAPLVTKLDVDDMIALVAYAASRMP